MGQRRIFPAACSKPTRGTELQSTEVAVPSVECQVPPDSRWAARPSGLRVFLGRRRIRFGLAGADSDELSHWFQNCLIADKFAALFAPIDQDGSVNSDPFAVDASPGDPTFAHIKSVVVDLIGGKANAFGDGLPVIAIAPGNLQPKTVDKG